MKLFLIFLMSLSWLLLGLILDKIIDHWLENIGDDKKKLFKKCSIAIGLLVTLVFVFFISKANVALEEKEDKETQGYITETVNASAEELKMAYDQNTKVILAKLRIANLKLDNLGVEKETRKDEENAIKPDKEKFQ